MDFIDNNNSSSNSNSNSNSNINSNNDNNINENNQNNQINNVNSKNNNNCKSIEIKKSNNLNDSIRTSYDKTQTESSEIYNSGERITYPAIDESCDKNQNCKFVIENKDLEDPEGKEVKQVKEFDENEDDEIESDIGWKGWKTVKIIGERYIYGIIVSLVVGFFVVILSLPKWSDGTNYLNNKVYSIFYIVSNLLFGPLYVVLGFIACYGVKRVKDARIIMYGSSIAIAFILIFVLLTTKGVNFWFYYLDVIAVIVCFVFGEVTFSFRISSTIQKIEKGITDHWKSVQTAYNYAAPDIIVTVFSLIYMFFLIPVYLGISSSILKLGWRLVIHPIYWTVIVMIARQFLDRDISTTDIMLNTNIVLHTFFHHQTLGKVFVYTFDSGDDHLTIIGIVVSAAEDILLRSIALKRDELFFTLLYGKERAVQHVYSQESLQLRAAILNIQVALDFSGLITAPIFVYMFNKHSTVFHVLQGSEVVGLTLFLQSLLSIGLDIIVEFTCTYIETRYYKLPIKRTWKWMKNHKSFLAWLIYGSTTMGLLAMIWLMVMVPRAGFCSSADICSCGGIMSNSIPSWCSNSTMTM